MTSIIAMLVIASVLCSGCLRPPIGNGAKSVGSGSSESVSRPADYFEGCWLCSGYESGGRTVSFISISSEERKAFPRFVLELGESGGTLFQINNGDGEYRGLFGGDSRSTSDGVRLVNEDGSLDFVLSGENLLLQPEDAASLEASVRKMGLHRDFNLPQGRATYYFERLALVGQPQVATFEFDGISIDVPVDVAYTLDSMTPETDEDGGVTAGGGSYRSHGPGMDFSSWPTDAGSIAEVIDESEGPNYRIEHADEFEERDGVLYHLHNNKDLNYSRLGFVANGKLYEIVFHYDDEDTVDYTAYRERFFTTIRFAGKDDVPARSDTIPSGAIPWREAAQHVGETVTICGPVADTEYANSSDGQPAFIDLGVAYPDQNRVTVVVWGEDRSAFPEPPEMMYLGKTLCVTGEVYVHEGVCNIKATTPAQVKIVTD